MNRAESLSINEIGAFIHGAHHSKDERIKEAGIDSQIEFELETLFKRLDVDKDGVLNEEELFKAMNAASQNRYSFAEIKGSDRKCWTRMGMGS